MAKEMPMHLQLILHFQDSMDDKDGPDLTDMEIVDERNGKTFTGLPSGGNIHRVATWRLHSPGCQEEVTFTGLPSGGNIHQVAKWR